MAGHARARMVGETGDARRALQQLRPRCPTCGRRFEPCRRSQRFDRPSCRVRFERQARVMPLLDAIGAGPSP